MIIVDGLIGAGKTWLCKDLRKRISKSKIYFEPVENNPYLTLFYEDMKRWGLEMQFFLMAYRFKMHQEAVKEEWENGIQTIHDRSIWGDLAFARMLAQDGIISAQGFQTYMDHRNMMISFLLVPQVVVWLEASPEVCIKRLKKRGRSSEKGIPVEYLANLRKTYEGILKEMEDLGSLVMRFDWEEVGPDSGEAVYKKLKECGRLMNLSSIFSSAMEKVS